MKRMIRKILVPLCLSCICGSICGKLIYEVYDTSLSNDINGDKIYLIQAGAYSTYDNMVDNTSVTNYVYYEDEDGLYKAIIGITEDYDNVEKISNSYGEEVIVTEYYSKDSELNDKIREYDLMLKDMDSNDEIQDVVLEMLTLYKDRDTTLVKSSS